jgi:hypothetical protein
LTAIRVSQRERQAATAFRCGEPITEIAACLGVSVTDAEAWLDSDRLAEVCQTITRSDTHRNTRNNRKHKP